MINKATYLSMVIRVALCGLACVSVHLAHAAEGYVDHIAAEKVPPETVETVHPNRSDLRITERMRGRVVVQAQRPAPVRIDEQLVPPPEDLTTRRFSLDAVGVAERADLIESELLAVMEPWLGRELSFAEFQLAAVALLEYLQGHGHPNASLRFSQMQFRENRQVAVAIEGLTPPDYYQDGRPRIMVAGYEVDGVTVVPQERVESHMAQWADRELTVEELEEAAESLAGLLRSEGYGLARAWLPPQEIVDGVVRVAVLEGVVDGQSGLDGVTVSNEGQRTRAERLQPYFSAAVQPDQPLNVERLERAVRLVDDLPGVRAVQADLSPGSQPGTTQVLATVEEAPLANLSITADNYGSVYSGQNRLSAALNLNSPAGYGEQYFANVTGSSGMTSFKVGGHMPVGYHGLRIGLSHAQMKVDIGEELAFLSLSSQSQITSLFANYPLRRGADSNVYLTAAMEHKHYRNQSPEFLGAFDNDRVIRVGSVGLSGDLVDAYRGRTAWGITAQHGDLDLSGNRDYQQADEATTGTAGSFGKANLSLSRLQALPADGWYLYGGFSGQHASGNLDSSEKFQLGGPMGVRAYPVGEGVGDHGWLINLELRKRLGRINQMDAEWIGFYDVGEVTQYAKPWPGALPNRPNSYRLAGYGTGISLTYAENGSLRLTYAHKDGNNPNPTPAGTDSDGRNDAGRIWLIGTILF